MSNDSVFSKTIMEQKYSHTKKDGSKETWEEISKRVTKHVMRAVNAPPELIKEIEQIIKEKKFIPGGRYLYASGRPFHQTQNCLLLKAEDSREGWADLMQKSTLALCTGAGIGVDYSDIRAEGKLIRRTGGFATGPISLMQMVNECGRGIMQGGSRRSAIWAGLRWSHQDIHKFIGIKNWSPEVRALKEKDFNFPATLDGTNVSVILDDEFFKAFHNEKHKMHAQAQSVYWATIKQMLKTAEPGFSVDTGMNVNESLRNACQPGYATVLTPDGIATFDDIDVNSIIWSGTSWTKVIKKWSTGIKAVNRYRTTAGNFIGTDNHSVMQNGCKIFVEQADSIDICVGPDSNLEKLDPNNIIDGLVLGDGSVHKASNNLVILYIGEKDFDYFSSEIKHLFYSSPIY